MKRAACVLVILFGLWVALIVAQCVDQRTSIRSSIERTR